MRGQFLCRRLKEKYNRNQKELNLLVNYVTLKSMSIFDRSLSKSSPRHANVGTDELDHDIIVKDVEATSSSQRSVETTPRQADIAGSLGESFCPYQVTLGNNFIFKRLHCNSFGNICFSFLLESRVYDAKQHYYSVFLSFLVFLFSIFPRQ